MTKILFFRKPDAFGVMEVHAAADRIVAAINHGRWEEYLPGEDGPLFARRQGDVVVVTYDAPLTRVERPQLSRRELQVLALLAEGLTTAQIALSLGLSPRTIRGYVASLKARLEAQNIQQLMVRAAAMGLVRMEEE